MAFKLTFECSGDKISKDDLWQLSVIQNRFTKETKDGPFYYCIKYWEYDVGTKNNPFYYVDEEELRNCYSEQLDAWLEEYDVAWRRKYLSKESSGNIWIPSNVANPSNITPKRTFENTPSKSRQKEEKKSRVIDDDDDDDDEVLASRGSPTKKQVPQHFGSSRGEMSKSSGSSIARPSRPSRPPVPLFSGPSRVTQSSSSSASASRSMLPTPPPPLIIPPYISSGSSSANSSPESRVRKSRHGADISMPDANYPTLSAIAMGKRPQIDDSDDEDMEDIGNIPTNMFHGLEIDSDAEDEIQELVTLSDARILSVDRLIDIAQESQIDLHPSVDDEPQDIEMEDIGGRPRVGVNRTSIYDQNSAKLIEGYEKGLHGLVQAAMEFSGLPDDKWVQKRKESGLWSELSVSFMFMIAGINSKILEHVVRGDLPKALQAPENLVLRHKMKKLMGGDKKEARPYIYIHYLVNFEGDSPTANELKLVISSVKIYIRGYGAENDEQSQRLAIEVDNAIESRGSILRPGQRRYVEKESWKQNILKWIKALEIRLEFEIKNGRGSEPLSRPLTEVGYAQSLDRLEQHRKHRSSNYIMNLVEAVCRVRFLQEYKNRQYIIFNLMEASDGMYGEILCTRFAQGYIANGGGFSHCAAGISVHTTRKLGDEYWSKVRKEILAGGELGRNVRREVKKLKERKEVYDKFMSTAKDMADTTQRLIDLKETWEKKKDELEKIDNKISDQVEQYIRDGQPLADFLEAFKR
ncbi:uncharacterized protein EAE98_007057 [Botrytis deweyae]|uniref:Uncharacterized protein n=1 Tax=Botrytis deweyae TaxID=2478750 RepID=A0ABQ7II87_9HELO|nr:uncharacterized protein EAE98_007057 [Botrytis deweyae]KAF7924969.1 hypothetical protein EAE98_007057 [Botrytis deweyae]